jgi:hypothetical protein
MTNTTPTIREQLESALNTMFDTYSKRGNKVTIRRGFFYFSQIPTSLKVSRYVEERLNSTAVMEKGVRYDVRVVNVEYVNRPFTGGGSVTQNSHVRVDLELTPMPTFSPFYSAQVE